MYLGPNHLQPIDTLIVFLKDFFLKKLILKKTVSRRQQKYEKLLSMQKVKEATNLWKLKKTSESLNPFLHRSAFGVWTPSKCKIFENIVKNGTFALRSKCSIFNNIFKTLKRKKDSLENIWKFELFIENDAMF